MRLNMQTTEASRIVLISSLVLLFRLTNDQGGSVEACFDPEKSWNKCITENNLSLPYQQKGRGYDFGWGALDQTREMCRTFGHVNTIKCMIRIVENSCGNSVSAYVYQHTMDADAYQRAAKYMCEQHNLKVFYDEFSCLKQNEKAAERCSRTKNDVMVIAFKHISKSISNKSMSQTLNNKQKLQNYMEEVLSYYACMSQKDALQCIDMRLIRDRQCSDEVIKLIVNYFKELLPRGCSYTAIDRSVYEQDMYGHDESIADPEDDSKSPSAAADGKQARAAAAAPAAANSRENSQARTSCHQMTTLLLVVLPMMQCVYTWM